MLKQESLRRENRGKTYDLCMRIDKMMRRIDPYQHHGIHFVHEKELLSFPDLYLPVGLLADAKCLLGSTDIKINFIVAYIIGTLGILSSLFGVLHISFTAIIPILVMFIFLIINIKFRSKHFIANEQLGDSFYYLGFF